MVAFLGGIVLGSILLAVALFKRRIVPVWSPVLLVAWTVLGYFGETQMLSALSLLILVAALAPLRQKIWSLSDEAWRSGSRCRRTSEGPGRQGPARGNPHPACQLDTVRAPARRAPEREVRS